LEQRIRNVERQRSQPVGETNVERILADMQADDEVTRAHAVRQICPCRMPWPVFNRLRKAAKRLQNDPSPLVSAHARHIEEDARAVASMESALERTKEYEEEFASAAPRSGKRDKRRTG
jgi:hypothetical protein